MAASGGFDPGDQSSAADDGRDDKIRAAIANGRNLMGRGQFDEAGRVIREAINMCPCNPDVGQKTGHQKDPTCNISQCIAAVKSDDPYALDTVARGPCACGYSWPTCTHPLHAMALDANAERLEKTERYLGAFSAALAIVRLDPASAVGYCRAARVLSYLLKNCSLSNPAVARSTAAILRGDGPGAPSALRLRRVLNLFLEHAWRNVERHRRGPKGSHDIILQRMAYSLGLKVSRRDPVNELPVEVLSMIFKLLEPTEYCRCLRVNKQWNRVVLADSLLWADLRLGRPDNPGRSFASFLQKHQGIKTFVIRDASAFQLNETKLNNIVQGLPKLKRLCLGSGKPYPGQQCLALPDSWAPRHQARLTQLSVVAFSIHGPIPQLIALNSETLEVLDIVHAGLGVHSAFESVSLPKLKKLRIVQGMSQVKDFAIMSEVAMRPIVLATPNLEQVHLDGVITSWQANHDPSPDEYGLWPSLCKLKLGPQLLFRADEAFNHTYARFLPLLSNNMRSIEILTTHPPIAPMVLSNYVILDPGFVGPGNTPVYQIPDTHLRNIEVFRCVPSISPHILKPFLEPAAKAGNLKVLELGAPKASETGPGNPTTGPGNPTTDLAFAHSDNIHTLGLHNFNFFHDPTSRFGATSQFDGQPFLDWLECFPKLHTVAVYPGQWEGVASFIAKLILHPKVRVIHQECLKGVDWYEAMKLAERHGVELRHTPVRVPISWEAIEEG